MQLLEKNQFASQIFIKINGEKAQPEVVQDLISVTVDQHSRLPGMFTLRLHDSDLKHLSEGPFDLTKEIEISAENAQGEKIVLIQGEITALEPEFQEGMAAELVVRGYDRSHRLFRETKSRAFLNIKDSDLAVQFAEEAGLTAQADPTSTVYEHLFQDNQSDLAFLMQRAWRIGYECFVSEGKLFFRRPPSGGSALKISWGEDLLAFQACMSLAEQVNEVVVRGWDVEKQQPIVGRADQGRLYPQVQEAKEGAGRATTFGAGKQVFVDLPVANQAEANALAGARLDELSGTFIEAEGVAFRCPDLRAGSAVEIAGLGKRFSGVYLVTSATHEYGQEGLKTRFSVHGARTGLLSEQVRDQAPTVRWAGVVTATVTNTEDPKNWGRVRVKFAWMTEDAESDWARVACPGAGPQAGFFAMPGVGDEVLAAFEHGDFSRPFVVGGLWNGQSEIPPEAAEAAAGEKPLVRTWHSRGGHRMVMYDDAKKKIEIVTADGRSITLDDADQTITLKTKDVEVRLQDDQLAVKAKGGVTVKSESNLKLEANGNIDIRASGNVNINGAMVNLN